MKLETPERLVRMTVGPPTIDLAARTIRNVVTTRRLARDGGIVLPQGIVTRFFVENPVVMAIHGRAIGAENRAPVIGRSLGLERESSGMVSTTQFADTELGREYAYLYGLNEKREVFMRAWSFGWSTLEVETWTLDQAKGFLGADWEEDTLSVFDKRINEVWVAKRSEMHEYSAVPVGADREALSRAFNGNVRVAGELVTAIDLQEATQLIRSMRAEMEDQKNRLEQHEQQIQALRRDGASAAARGDTDALLAELRELARLARNHNN